MLRERLAPSLLLLFLALSFASSANAKNNPPTQPVNLNTATAEKSPQMRNAYRSFKSVDDLVALRGLGAKRLE
jgi:DNA uptake protein ComE-like DNA-binding protein